MTVEIGTPLSASATRVMLLGAGELGKEVAIELQRLGAEVVAVDRYSDAPAMQVAHRSYAIDMLDPAALRQIIRLEAPHVVVPEVEAIATDALAKAADNATGEIVGSGRVHGTNMLGKIDGIEAKITAFVRDAVHNPKGN